jgi:hypothetical protein
MNAHTRYEPIAGEESAVVLVPGKLLGEHVTEACKRLAATHEPGFAHWWSVRRVELPEGTLGPARTVWLGCANFAAGAAVFVARDDYDAALRALLGSLLEAEGT